MPPKKAVKKKAVKKPKLAQSLKKEKKPQAVRKTKPAQPRVQNPKPPKRTAKKPTRSIQKEKKSMFGVCSYYLHETTGKKERVYLCKHCGRYFCENHKEASLPNIPGFAQGGEGAERKGHPCIPFIDFRKEELEKELEEKQEALEWVRQSETLVDRLREEEAEHQRLAEERKREAEQEPEQGEQKLLPVTQRPAKESRFDRRRKIGIAVSAVLLGVAIALIGYIIMFPQ